MHKRNICVVITDKAHLSRLVTLLKEIKRSARFRLQIIVGGGALTYRYGNVVAELRAHGFEPDLKIPTAIEGGEHLGMAKTAALGMLEFATGMENLESDVVIVRGDRFEVLPIAAAAAYLNKTLIHLEGGDVSGSIDESVRHAITKLGHGHFVTNEQAKARLIRLGERKDRIWNVGSLDVDFLRQIKFLKHIPDAMINKHGTGAKLDLGQPYAVVMLNPVTTEANLARQQAECLLTAIHSLKMQAVWIWPNLGAGSDAIAKRIREWQIEHDDAYQIRFIRYLKPEHFANVLNQAQAVIGNSSVGIKESGWLGVPAVNVGTRQHGRLMGKNVMNVLFDERKIVQAIRKQVRHGKYERSFLYGNGETAKKIMAILKKVEIKQQKMITY